MFRKTILTLAAVGLAAMVGFSSQSMAKLASNKLASNKLASNIAVNTTLSFGGPGGAKVISIEMAR
jgi:hypothetical protein